MNTRDEYWKHPVLTDTSQGDVMIELN